MLNHCTAQDTFQPIRMLVSGRPVRHNHVHINFAESLQCSGNGNISLVGGASSNEGRVEVCVNGMWGTVTNYGWDSREATVVCKQLGYQNPGE